ncbi:MAG: hypothetical protein ACI841_001024 [Planctomycetota bacterium]|jgi:hypothetical protein
MEASDSNNQARPFGGIPAVEDENRQDHGDFG